MSMAPTLHDRLKSFVGTLNFIQQESFFRLIHSDAHLYEYLMRNGSKESVIPDDIRDQMKEFNADDFDLDRFTRELQHNGKLPDFVEADEVETIMSQARCTREQAVEAYERNNRCIVDAILDLTP
jgi:NACalpha-BTF3-like transcription factor